MTSAPAIGFEYRPSRLLRRLPADVAALALAAVASSGLAWWGQALLMPAIAAAAVRQWRRAGRDQIVAAGWQDDGGWQLRLADGSDVAASLRMHRCYGGAVLLRLAVAGRKPHTLLLTADNLDADTRRRLRMRLAVAGPRGELPPAAA